MDFRRGFQIWFCNLPQMTRSLDHKVQFLVYGPIWLILFSFTWKLDGDSKSDIVLYLKWLTGTQKFVIMIRCKINFNMIWYSVKKFQLIYTCQYSSYHLVSWTSFLWNLSFLFNVFFVGKGMTFIITYNIYIRNIVC